MMRGMAGAVSLVSSLPAGIDHQEFLPIGGDSEVAPETRDDVREFDRLGCGKRLQIHFRNEDAGAVDGHVVNLPSILRPPLNRGI